MSPGGQRRGLGAVLLAAAKAHNQDIEQMAAAVGFTPIFLQAIVDGRRDMSLLPIASVAKLASYTNIIGVGLEELVEKIREAVMEETPDDKSRFIFRERLEVLLDQHGIPPLQRGRIVQLSEMLATSQVTVRRWLDPDNPVLPGTAMIIRIADTFGASIDELLGRKESELGCASCEMSRHLMLPTMEIREGTFFRVRTTYVPKDSGWLRPGGYYTVFNVSSDAMYPTLRVGDLAVLEGEVKVDENKIYGLFFGGRITFRRVMIGKSGKIQILADNQHYPMIEYDPEEVDITPVKPGETAVLDDGRLRILGRVCAALKVYP